MLLDVTKSEDLLIGCGQPAEYDRTHDLGTSLR